MPHNGSPATPYGFRKRVLYLDGTHISDDLIGAAEALAEREEGEVGRRVVEERRDHPGDPEELPRLAHAELGAARAEELERRQHRDEDAEEQRGDLGDRAPAELVGRPHVAGRPPEGEPGEREDRGLARGRGQERDGQHDSGQPHRVERADRGNRRSARIVGRPL